MQAKLSISRTSFGCGKEVIAIHIKDSASGKTITEVHVNYAEFAQAITGLSAIPCEIDKLVSAEGFEKLGKKRVVESVYCVKAYDKTVQREIVLEDFSKYSDEWELLDDGIRTQQNDEKHRYTLVKWV